MLKIFDKNHNAIGHLVKYKDCKVESELSTGDKTLSFVYLAKHHNLENEMYVRTKDDEFVVKEVPATTGSYPQIVAILNLEDLQRDMWEKFSVTDVTIDEAARTVLAGTGWRIGECDVTKRRNAGMIQASTLEVIQNLCTAFMCEPVFDTINKTVSFYSKRGEDKGTYFMSGLNLKKLQKKVTSYDYYTRIIPIGSNGLTIEDVNDGKKYLENYQYSNKVLTYIWKDESYTDPQALKEDAELKLDDLSKPEKAYSAEIYNLAKQKPGYSILSYGLGDTIVLIDRETGTREKQRIVKTVEYLQDHSKDTCEIANTFLTFEEMQQKVQSAAEIINYTITGDGRYTGTINVSDILHFEQGLVGSATVEGINGSISTMQGDLGVIKTKVGEVEANYLKADEAEIKYAKIENLDVTNQIVHSIQGDYAEFKTVTANELSAMGGNITNLSGELSTYKTQVTGQLTAFDADITNLKAKDAELETALIGTAKITDLEAIRTKTQSLEADVADINTLVNGNLTSDNIHSLVLTGDKVTVENGFIKSAMIESLAADKITGLDINTTKLTVHSEDGRSTWTDNTIQIADGNRVRVQIGEDAAGDYNLYLWDAAGNLLWNATGVTESGLNDGIIKDVAVADDANISGSKLDIESVIREVNGAETTIKGARIKLDSQNQTLDAAFTSLKSYAEGVNSRTESNETAISVAQGQISTLISSTTIVKDGKTVQLKDAYNSTVADVNSIKTTLNEHTSLIDEQSGEILAVQTKANTIESDLAGTKQTVSAVQSDLSGTKSRVTTVETGMDGLKTRVANTETALTKKADGTTVGSLTSRVATAETTINGFQASLTATDKTVSDNYTALKNYTDNSITGVSEIDLVGTAAYTLSQIKTHVANGSQNWNVVSVPSDLKVGNKIAIYIKMPGHEECAYIVKGICTKINSSTQVYIQNPVLYDLGSYAANALIATHTEQISTHDTRITANENAINLKVSTSDFNSYKATVTGQINTVNQSLSTTNQEISVMKGQIALKVEQTDIDTAVNRIEVGGRNLLQATKSFDNLRGGMPKVSEIYQGLTVRGGAITTSNTPVCEYIFSGFNLSDTYTLSFYAKGNVSQLHAFFYGVTGYVKAKAVAVSQNAVIMSTSYGDGNTRFTLTNEWKRYWVTWQLDDTGDVSIPKYILLRTDGSTVGQNVYVCGVMFEKSNKAGDWTPAPEDVDASITAVDNKFASYSTTTQMQSAIDIAKNSITQSVSETYATKNQVNTVSGNVTTLTSRVTAAESKLTKDSLVTTIGTYYTTASYVGTAIDGIEIGGRNLIANTGPSSVTGWTASSGWTVSLVDCATAPYGKAIRATNGTATSGGVHKPPIAKAKMVNSEKYTISAWIRASKACTLNFRNEMMGSNTISVTTAWQKYTFTSTINTGATYYSDIFYVASGIANGMWIEVHSLKLEKGTKATDWEPALEDMESSIDSVKTVATQTSEKFNWLVKSGTSASDFTLTDRTATLVANAINLKGLVTFSGLDSAAQSKINTAQSTADTAKNNAATALNRATYQYGTCSTAAATAAKVVTLSGFSLYTGAMVTVRFQYGNTAANPTLNVNNTGAKSIITGGAASVSDSYTWKTAYATIPFIYDGTYWRMVNDESYLKAATAQSTADTARAEIASLGKITVKKYDITGASGSVKWIKLGTLVSNGDASNTIITVYSGNGYNGTANQNSQVEIIIKDGWQSTQSAATSFGVSVTRQNCESLTVKVMATAHNTCDVWVYMPWTCWNGMYTIVGSYASWTHSGANQSGAPTTGTEQNLAYRANAENATTAANLANTTLANWCYNNDKTYINGGKIYTGTIAAAQIAANAVTAEKINVSSLSAISANLGTVTAGIIKSANYKWTSGNFNDAGTYINLSNGGIWTKNFTVDSSGNAYFRGTLQGATGSFSGDITASSILANNAYHLRSVMQDGTALQSEMVLRLTSYNSSGNIRGLDIGILNANDYFNVPYLRISRDDTEGKTNSISINANSVSIGNFEINSTGCEINTDFTVGGTATFNGSATVNGEFKFNDYSNTKRRPVASTSSNTSRVAFIGSKLTSGTYALSVNGQWGGDNFSTKTVNTTTSDIRLKENVAPATVKALPVLNKIHMYQFDWKQDHTHWDVGFVADYLEKVDSKFAIGGGYNEDGNIDEKSVNEFYLMGYVVKGVQELCDWNVWTDARLDSMEAKYQSKTASLEAELESVRYQLQQAFTRIAEQEKLIKRLQAAG